MNLFGMQPFAPLTAISLLASVLFSTAAPLRFEPPVLRGDQLQLRLPADPGQNLRIEASADLVTWSLLQNATGGATALTFDLPLGGAVAHRFFRAVSTAPALPFPSVFPVYSSNGVAGAILRPGEVTSMIWTGPGGEIHTVTVPTNAVTEPVLLTLSVITQLTGVPAAQGFLSGVRLEPAGLVLAAPLTWEVEFPTPLNVPRMASYTFDNDGNRLHLVPDQVTSSRVRIRTQQLRSLGTGEFTEAEITALAATVPPPRSPGVRFAPQATMEECYPEDEKAARELRQRIEDFLAPIQQETARVLSLERQKQLLGVEDDGNATWANELIGGMEKFDAYLAQEAPSATQRCATTREWMTWMLGLERQRQLLGVGENSSFPLGTLFCAASQRCQQQALQCCQTKGGDTRLIAFLLGIERQRQLLGATEGCGSIDFDEMVRQCAPKWTGTLTLSETGSFYTNQSNASQLRTRRIQHSYELTAQVASVEEEIVPAFIIPIHTNLVFKLTGQGVASRLEQETSVDLWDPCSGSQPAPAGVIRPRDGGDALEYRADVSYQTNVFTEFTVNARLMDPGSGLLGITPELRISLAGIRANATGWITHVTKTPTSEGCEIDDQSGRAGGTKTIGQAVFTRQNGGFQYTADSINFLRITPLVENGFVVLQRLELNFRRVRP